jgi:hypothetical protein
VKWRHYKVHFYQQETMVSPPAKLPVPFLFNLYTNPQEDESKPALDTWVIGPVLKMVAEFEESTKKSPADSNGRARSVSAARLARDEPRPQTDATRGKQWPTPRTGTKGASDGSTTKKQAEGVSAVCCPIPDVTPVASPTFDREDRTRSIRRSGRCVRPTGAHNVF